MKREETPPAGRSRRWRAAALTLAGLALCWIAAGLHRAPPAGTIRIRSWVFGGEPVALTSGWALSPPWISRTGVYPVEPLTLKVRWDASTGPSLRSQEGVALLAAGTLVVSADLTRAGELARSFPDGWGVGPSISTRAEPILMRCVGDALASLAAATSFQKLVEPVATGDPRVAELARRVSGAGISLLPRTRIGFYPAPRPAVATASGSGPGSGRPSRRVLLVGLDGADWDIIDPLLARGELPHLERLIAGGVRARLKTITPVLSPIIWTSIATGVGPERHGIVDFLVTSKTTGEQIPVTSNMRQVKALWNILGERGLSVGTVAWWATWPAEPVNGYIVSDRVAYQLFGYAGSGDTLRHRTYPEALALAIQPHVMAPAQVTDAQVERILPGGGLRTPEGAELVRKLRTIIASTETYLGIGLELMSAYDPDLRAIYFEGTDTVAHNFMRYRPPAMAGVRAEELAAYGDVVDRYYRYQDEALGRLLAQFDERTMVIVCSDHGFRSGSSRPATDPRIEMGGAADWHRKFGILVMAGPGVRRGGVLEDVSVLDITPTILAAMGLPVGEDMSGRALSEAFEPGLEVRTIASYETAGHPRQAEPEPQGSVVDEEIIAKLRALGYVAQEGANALNNTGITLLDRGRYTEAADAFLRALREEPRFVQARINLGRAQMLMKQHDAAIATLQESLKHDPAQAEVHNLLGNIYMERGDTARAEASFKKSLAIQPDGTNTLNSLGLLYDRLGRDDLAIEQYRRVVAIDPDYAEGYNNIGLIHRKRGDPSRAIDLFLQAIKADADFPGSYNNMGLAYQDLGDLAKAREAFERGLSVEPNNAVILNNLGTIDLAQHDLTAARGRFEQAIAADPEYPSAYNNLGAVLGMLGQADQAFEQYLKAVELDPNYTDARFNLARHFVEQHKPREAIEMLERLLAIDPGYGKALLQLGIVLAQQGDLHAALERVTLASRRMPDSAEPHNILAEIHLALGNKEAARRELGASLRIDATQARVSEMLRKLTAEQP